MAEGRIFKGVYSIDTFPICPHARASQTHIFLMLLVLLVDIPLQACCEASFVNARESLAEQRPQDVDTTIKSQVIYFLSVGILDWLSDSDQRCRGDRLEDTTISVI